MPLPIVLVIGGVGIGTYILGRFFKRDKEHDLKNQLDFSDAKHIKEKQELRAELKKSRKEILKELIDE